MEPYRDNFGEEPRVPETVEFSSNDDDSDDDYPRTRMTPMTVVTDYDSSVLTTSSSVGTMKKIGVALCLFVGLLVFDYFWNRGNDDDSLPLEYSTGRTFVSSSSSSNNNNIAVNDECQRYDATYFAELLHRVEHWNQTQLCTTEFNVHGCKCLHPFIPTPQDRYPGWLDVLQMNVQSMEYNYTQRRIQPEVVIYGDSITEHLIGRHFGRPSSDYADIAAVTRELLTKRGGGRINGLPMGIVADQMANLLYRLQHGEMPERLQPKVWWILIGTNDIGMACSIDTVVAGTIRIVKQIREQHHNQQGHKTLTPVVINSILPRGKAELNSDHSAYGIIRRVNQQLNCYAQFTHGVYFVNATNILTETHPDGETYLKEGYFAGDSVHPSAEGTRKWEELIVETVLQFMTR